MAVERWEQNVRLVTPPGAFVGDLGWRPASRRALAGRVRALPAGTPVVLRVSAPLASRRCRRFAAQTGIEVNREYLALPSAGAPAYLVEDAPGAAALFVRSILAPPPRSRMAAPVAAGLAMVRRLADPGVVLRALAPGRLVVGRLP